MKPDCLKNFTKSQRTFFLGLLLAVATLLVYGRVGGFDFTCFDDPYYIYNNPVVNKGLTWRGMYWALTTSYPDFWHPVTWWSHMLDCELFGLRPGLHHLVNLGFHVANTLLLFGLLWRMTGAWKRSTLVAALFALHPLHVESVAWVAERKDVLSAFFFLLTLWAYTRYARSVTSGGCQVTGPEKVIPASVLSRVTCHRSLFYWLALLFFALGLMAKAMLVTLPFVLLLLDYWPLGRVTSDKWQVAGDKNSKSRGSTPWRGEAERRRLNHLLLEKWPFFGLTLASCTITCFNMKNSHQLLSAETIPWGFRLANVPVSYVRYLGKLIWPSDLAVCYPRPAHWDVWPVAGAVLILVLISGFAVVRFRRAPYLIFGWLMFLGTLVPVIGIVAMNYESIADRYTYIPSVGLLTAGVWGMADVSVRRRWRNGFVNGMAALVLLIYSVLTWIQTGYWRDSLTLWTHCLAVTRDNAVAQQNFGIALQTAGRLDEAIGHYREAIRLEPNYVDAYLNLGVVLAGTGRMHEATNYFARVLQLQPAHTVARANLGHALVELGDFAGAVPLFTEVLGVDSNNVAVLTGMARALSAQGRSDEVFDYCSRVLQLAPAYPDAYFVLGLELFKRGRFDEAISNLSEAVRLKPAWADARCKLALAFVAGHATAEAIAQYRETLRLNPDLPEALNNLAWILSTCPEAEFRNGAEAVQLAQHACAGASSQKPMFIGTLAAAYAEAGQFEKAVETAQKACALAASLGQTNLFERNQMLLRQYQNRQPYREGN